MSTGDRPTRPAPARILGVHTRVAHLTDRSLRYLETGGGRALVLLHAFPLSADQWLPQLARVTPGWRVIAPDLRGFRGAGPAFEQPGLQSTSIDDYARDVLAVCDHLEIGRAVFGGCSMGGYVCLALHRLAPDRVAGLVLAHTRASADAPEVRAGRDHLIARVQAGGMATVEDAMLPRLLGETTRRLRPDLEDAVRRLIRFNRVEAVTTGLAAMRDRADSTPALAAIRCPTLVVAGAEDAVVSVVEAESLQQAIARSTLAVLPHAGHLSNLEEPAWWEAVPVYFADTA
jgi:pimeloyl-ACP methyl ester carboxylesterase